MRQLATTTFVLAMLLRSASALAADTAANSPDGATAAQQEAAPAQPEPAEPEPEGVSMEGEDFGGSAEDSYVRLYGFLDAYWEKVAQTPAGIDGSGETIYEENPYEFDVPNVNVMMQTSLQRRYKAFLNLKAPGAESLEVRNAWLEAQLIEGLLAVRAGKLYRRFGLYNEILDAVPTYIGIEPPEMFEKDHLLVTRTTNLMILGEVDHEDHKLSYALSTGNDERLAGAIPVGLDLH
jgi:hypothetical protein